MSKKIFFFIKVNTMINIINEFSVTGIIFYLIFIFNFYFISLGLFIILTDRVKIVRI